MKYDKESLNINSSDGVHQVFGGAAAELGPCQAILVGGISCQASSHHGRSERKNQKQTRCKQLAVRVTQDRLLENKPKEMQTLSGIK